MLNADIDITKQVEDARYNRDNTRTAFIRVEFHVGKHGPFVERFDKDGYSREVRDARLNAFADSIGT